MLYQFAAAEVDSDRWSGAYRQCLSEDQTSRLRGLPIKDWTDSDCAAALAGVDAVRGAYVEPLLATGPKWFATAIPVERLAQVRVIKFGAFQALTPKRSMYDFVRALDEGRDTPGDGFARGYRALRACFDPGRMRGCPVIVALGDDGPFTEVEGLTRMCCLLSKHLSGEPVSAPLDVMIGISPRVSEWGFF